MSAAGYTFGDLQAEADRKLKERGPEYAAGYSDAFDVIIERLKAARGEMDARHECVEIELMGIVMGTIEEMRER